MDRDGTAAGVATGGGQPSLHRNVVGLPASTFQGITHMAPAAGVMLGAGFVASSAGAAFPLAIGLAGLTSLLISVSINQMAKHLPSAGGYYTYVSRGINPKVGFLAGWVYFLYDPLIPNLCTLTVASYVAATIEQLFGIPFPWWLYCIIVYLGLGAITYLGLRPSIRTAIAFTLLEVVITLALSVALFGSHGVTGHDLGLGQLRDRDPDARAHEQRLGLLARRPERGHARAVQDGTGGRTPVGAGEGPPEIPDALRRRHRHDGAEPGGLAPPGRDAGPGQRLRVPGDGHLRRHHPGLRRGHDLVCRLLLEKKKLACLFFLGLLLAVFVSCLSYCVSRLTHFL